jgi:hypothetical protein
MTIQGTFYSVVANDGSQDEGGMTFAGAKVAAQRIEQS